MKRIIENRSDQGILFSNHYIGDRLSENDEIFLFKSLIDKLDLRAINQKYGREGGKMFAPRDQLAIILYAFHKGITSSVKIADLIRTDLRFIYLAGGNIIKRRTISDFRIHHREEIRKIFESSVELALETGVVKTDKLFALDGSKIEAQASFSKTRKKEEWEARKAKIVEHVDDYLREWEEQDKREEDFEEKQREEFQKIKKKLDAIKDGQIKGKEENLSEEGNEKDQRTIESEKQQNEKRSTKESKAIYKKNKIVIKGLEDTDKLLTEYEKIEGLLEEYESADDDMLLNLTDPDCRIMQSDSKTKECYNVQAIANNQVIVAAEVTQDENDQYQLEPMVEQLKNNIDLKDTKITFASDAGYNRGKNLSYIDHEENIDAYISMFNRNETTDLEKNEFHKENFTYDEGEDNWTCPGGQRLEFMKEFMRDGKKFTLYGCELKKCVYCSNRTNCLTSKADIRRGYRTLEDDGCVVYRKEMKNKMSQDFAKKIYSKRAGCIEPVFGQVKNNRDFTRFRLKGLTKVRAEFLIMAIAHNLGKIMKHISISKPLSCGI